MQTHQIAGSDAPSCVVLVVSSDGYCDLWTPFFTLFKQHWPDCGMPVFLGTNSGKAELDWVPTLNCGQAAWSTRLRSYLRALSGDYVLLLLEDFFLDAPVSNAQVMEQLKRLDALKGVSLRLFPNPPADYFHGGMGVIHARAAYRVSLQGSIWNRLRLLELLVDGESPWEFEWRGSERSRSIPDGFYCVRDAVIRYRHVVERGEWFRSAAQYYAGQEIGCDFAARPVMGWWKTGKKAVSNPLRRLLNRMQSHWLRWMQPEKIADGG